MRKLAFALLLIALASAAARADLLIDLEGGNFSAAQKAEAGAHSKDEAAYYQALEEFYGGRLDRARELLTPTTFQPSAWLKNYLSGEVPQWQALVSSESEHFILKTAPQDQFLAPYALETLEAAYQRIGKELNVFPQNKVPVEIYPTQEAFVAASTLSQETLERSGAIGICKFRRLMILSPEQLAYGYRWLDTLAHEYTHYLINIASAGRCPLWLHEGTAKFFETTWRLDEPLYLTPGNRTELARGLKENRLVPFARMEPSMVYLKDQAEVRLAFAQVAHALHYIQTLKGPEGLRDIFKELAAGKTREQAFKAALGLSPERFEESWKEFLKRENLRESPGSAPDMLKLGPARDEVEEFVSTDLRGHVRLGDRMRQARQLQVALLEYDKALQQEPDNPVALVKTARTLLALGQEAEALGKLEQCVKQNPNYEPAYLILGTLKLRDQDLERALACFREANALNPFNPATHEKFAEIYSLQGREADSAREHATAEALSQPPAGQDINNVK